ncbi:MAG: Sugar transferases involved in lipopolysaccharide synthesis [Rhodobacteraceae bacterium HLUCCA12]|nr:MAG: Sugar transferases involved in lipopolysaccharide synthesis [Rhodobacteraceae bacterium HLUCCA12]
MEPVPNQTMTPTKRLFDLFTATVLSVFVVPAIAVIAVVIVLIEGGPVFHSAERMKTPRQGFRFYKFRTMRPDPDDTGVSGGDKTDRITPLGAFLRRTRLDELPQLFNLFRGDISVVGPRPPLRQYVERFPDVYEQVLQARPGITGLATIYFNRHERRLLARSRTPAQTDEIYCRACIPRKARLDLIYLANQGFCFDLAIILKTFVPSLR